MNKTKCIYCGSDMDWSSDFDYSDIFAPVDEGDEERTVTEMTCHKCGATAMFIQPPRNE